MNVLRNAPSGLPAPSNVLRNALVWSASPFGIEEISSLASVMHESNTSPRWTLDKLLTAFRRTMSRNGRFFALLDGGMAVLGRAAESLYRGTEAGQVRYC